MKCGCQSRNIKCFLVTSLLFHTFCARVTAVSIEDHVEANAEVFLYIAHIGHVHVVHRRRVNCQSCIAVNGVISDDTITYRHQFMALWQWMVEDKPLRQLPDVTVIAQPVCLSRITSCTHCNTAAGMGSVWRSPEDVALPMYVMTVSCKDVNCFSAASFISTSRRMICANASNCVKKWARRDKV